jgi:uncharacterized membrane protein YgcG
MDAQLETKLIDCLDALESGQSLDRILSRYPDDAAALLPLLEVAADLSRLRMEPSRAAEAASRRNFLTQAQATGPTPLWQRLFPSRLVVAFASLVLALVLLGGGVVASASALPGDQLYGVKRTAEDLRLSFAPTLASRDQLASQFEQERREEIRELLTLDREAEVEFSGPIESISADEWLVGGLTVRVDPTTHISGVPAIGQRATITGGTVNGRLFATTIVIEPGELPAPAPTATPTTRPSITPSRTASLTATTAPTSTVAPTDTPVPTLVPTTTPRPTQQPVPTRLPTAVPPPQPTDTPVPPPPPDDNANQNGNENSNDNGGGDDNGNDNGGGDDNGNDNGNDNGGDDGGGGGNDNDNGNDNGGGDGGGGNDNDNDNDNDGGGDDGSGGGNDNDNDGGGDNSGSGGGGDDSGGGGNDNGGSDD